MPAVIIDIRTRAGLTQAQCAEMTLAGLRTWKHWEAGTRSMPLAAMELWCLAILAGGHLPLGDWVDPWVRTAFRGMFIGRRPRGAPP
jgi:transcriptional regulator with XRE-family HTH domain